MANQLSETGFPVLRFDYYGTGDSAGDCAQSSIRQWKQDIVLAIEEAKKRSGKARICLAGLRLGATLSAMISKERNDIDSLILWEPVVSGKQYIDELNSLHKQMLKFSYVDNSLSTLDEILGFARNDILWAELSQLDLLEYFPISPPKIMLMKSDTNSSVDKLSTFLKNSGTNFYHYEILSPKVWTEEVFKQLVPNSLLNTIVQWLSKVYS
jgi:pimeloyl-ACP methyl ester carboxylesterase